MNSDFRTQHSPSEGIWSLQLGEIELLKYSYKNTLDACPSFPVVRTLQGEDIALYRPWDHPWHTGLYYSWKFVGDDNFWESTYGEKPNRCISLSFTDETKDGEPGFRQTTSHVNHKGDTLLLDSRSYRVRQEGRGYVLQCHYEFWLPGNTEITLDRTPLTPETPSGGYAGFSCRLQRTLLNPIITTDDGVYSAEAMYGRKARWCDWSGRIDGTHPDRWAGICLMDSPSNPRHPSPMLTYDYKNLQFIQAAFLCDAPYVLKPSERLSLSYACYIHDGQSDSDELARLYNAFAKRGGNPAI